MRAQGPRQNTPGESCQCIETIVLSPTLHRVRDHENAYLDVNCSHARNPSVCLKLKDNIAEGCYLLSILGPLHQVEQVQLTELNVPIQLP